MIDPFVLLTPVLLLGVIALLGLVGCNLIFGLQETTLADPIEDRTVLFLLKPDQVAASGGELNGTYQGLHGEINGKYLGLDFRTNEWRWEGPPDHPGDIFFYDPMAPSSSFTINYGKGGILKQMLVFTSNDGQIKLTDTTDGVNPVNPAYSQLITKAANVQTVITGWTKPAKIVKVEFTPGPGGGVPQNLGINVITITYGVPL